MAILIDGYNLLNAAGVERRGRGTVLAQARQGLLGFLASALTEDEATRTTIVFDSKDAPPGLPREEQFGAIRVLFAKGYSDADELIEELIRADHSPRQLLVVSSDHRLHRAARRRKASAVDSHQWLAELRRRDPREAPHSEPAKPTLEAQNAQWLAEFSSIDIEQINAEIQGEDRMTPAKGTPDESKSDSAAAADLHGAPADKRRRAAGKALKDEADDKLLPDAREIFPPNFFASSSNEVSTDDLNPFPPGYGQDVTDEDP
jgi:predicted RNA-binding protein with PIN domain